MDTEKLILLIGAIFGGGGIVAYLKARSETRNANKSADIKALTQTLDALQNSYRELQDRYQEAIENCDKKNKEIAERVRFLEVEYVRQEQEKTSLRERVKQLEEKLERANTKIEQLENDLHKRDIEIMRLEQQNIELRKRNGERLGLEKE